MNDKNEKLPLKSIHNKKCLTKCYPKGEKYLHPVLLLEINNVNDNTCAIEPVHSKDQNIYRENDIILVDECNIENNKNYKIPNELDSLLLNFYFNAEDFLSSVYNLKSFDDVIKWIKENNFLPIKTIKRVNQCAWKVFGNDLNQITENVIDYYYDTYLLKNWIKEYIKLIKEKYSLQINFLNKKNITDDNDIYKIIIDKYLTKNFFIGCLKKYIYEYEDKWENIETHTVSLKNYIFNSLIEKITQIKV